MNQASDRPRPRLCLNMIVKNEAANLLRCLASVAPYVDSYAIADTGSTDGTEDMIRDFFTARGVKGVVKSFPFEDFGQARNAALALAEKQRVLHEHDYLLLCDADMELVVEDPGQLAALNAAAYDVPQTASAITYDNVRLVRRDVQAHYVGATHEFLDLRGAESKRLEGVRFIDHCTGSNRGDKSERDMRLLKRTLASSPNDARSMFYLAQTLKDLGRHREAVSWYERRAIAGGFAEEAWYSRLMIARCLLELKDPTFENAALQAFHERPTRAEPLYTLAHHYREAGKNELAVLFAEAGKKIPYPIDDKLFVEHYIYEHGFDEEISIAGFYARDEAVRARARATCLDLTTRPGLSVNARADAGRNAIYYAESAPEIFPSAKILPLDTSPSSDDGAWSPTNPSIVAGPDGRIQACLRLVNYVVGTYVCRTGDNKIRTRNLLLDLDTDLVVTNHREIRDLTNDAVSPVSRVRGFEDLRLFHWNGRLWASATVLDRSFDGHKAEIAILELNDEGDVIRAHMQSAVEPELHQKNWVPLVRDGGLDDDGLFFIYRAQPTVILHAALEYGTATAVRASETDPARDLGFLRGSSQAISWGENGQEGWLYVSHEAHTLDGQRRYHHRLVELDSDLRITRVSEPFFFMHRGIEFCAGLARVGSRLVMSFGVDDAKAYLLEVEESDVRAWFEGACTNVYDQGRNT